MLKLVSRGNKVSGVSDPVVVKVFRRPELIDEWAPVALINPSKYSQDNAAVKALLFESSSPDDLSQSADVAVVSGMDCDHLSDGDVIVINPDGLVRTLFRRGSYSNTLFATERCNSFCLMCSQPPRKVDDDWRVEEMLKTIALTDPSTNELGISGGEPTLLGNGFLKVVEAAKNKLPDTAVHVLTNGRLFRYSALASALAEINHPDLMLGIPVYADIAADHDFVVQSEGAFEDTFLGLHNLANVGVDVEIRVVVHRVTVPRLVGLAEFIHRNFPFAAHVTFMGLEKTGFAIANWKDLWIDPCDYMDSLCEAVTHLADRGMNVSMFNHQLCVVPESHRHFCRQSISDWKAEYIDECKNCSLKEDCCGFFCFNVPDGTSRGIHRIEKACI